MPHATDVLANERTFLAYVRTSLAFIAFGFVIARFSLFAREFAVLAHEQGVEPGFSTAFGTAMIGALIFLQKLRISPDTAFSVNDWTAFVIFITVIGGIGRIEGPVIGTIVFFVLRQTLADLGSLYLLMMGAVAIVVMLWAPKGLWGMIAERFGWQALPLQRHLVFEKETEGKR